MCRGVGGGGGNRGWGGGVCLSRSVGGSSRVYDETRGDNFNVMGLLGFCVRCSEGLRGRGLGEGVGDSMK